jgi:hypothetical protein
MFFSSRAQTDLCWGDMPADEGKAEKQILRSAYPTLFGRKRAPLRVTRSRASVLDEGEML